MKLLLDQNLSPRLVARVADIFPDSGHVYVLGLDRSSDAAVWKYARDHDYVLVTKDADFSELIALRGFPPKIIWLRLGNCSTDDIERLLRLHYEAIRQLAESQDIGILSLL